MHMFRRAKIVCTLGPATATPERMVELVEAGMDIARLNFSHGSHADHARFYRMVRDASDVTGRAVGILADLQGPKIRLGTFAGGPVEWCPGDLVEITTEEVPGTARRVSTTYAELPHDVRPGNRLLVDDGKLCLEVVDVADPLVRARVIEGGPVSDHKGLSLPGVAVSVPALSGKDLDDLRFALSLRVDAVALSFVRSPDDAELARKVMDEVGERVPVIAKLERPEAVERLEEIIKTFDGVMVARGDLGVELPLEQVPLVQKRAVQLAREHARPVIVATQMLESMIDNSRPTRAEASDVANAVLDGADAVMLSGETSVGRYPVEAVRTMARIIGTVNASSMTVPPLRHNPRSKGGAISKAAKEVGEVLGAKALCCFTVTGDTVRRMSRFRCTLPLLAFTPDPSVRSQLALSWGVETFLTPYTAHTDEMVAQVQDMLLALGRFEIGDSVVIVAGNPPGLPGSTNSILVWRLGDPLEPLASGGADDA
ncbi:MAG: pyruvate kinase [Actinobacteria bacterium]|nr:pyruvate kinase [Actinomycetota bacterium]